MYKCVVENSLDSFKGWLDDAVACGHSSFNLVGAATSKVGSITCGARPEPSVP